MWRSVSRWRHFSSVVASVSPESLKHAISLRASVPHEVKATKSLRRDATFSVTLAPGEDLLKTVVLDPLIGSIQVETAPIGADVLLNGMKVGQSPLTIP